LREGLRAGYVLDKTIIITAVWPAEEAAKLAIAR